MAKVHEIMGQFSDSKCIVYQDGGIQLFEGYKAVCPSWCQNLWVEHFHNFEDNVVVVLVFDIEQKGQ